MKRIFLIFLFFVFTLPFAIAQNHSECDKAITVDKEITGPVYADGVPDPNLALKDSSGVYFEKPHAVVWFTFIIPEDTMLTFDLVPATEGDDIDFLLFKDETGNFCKIQKIIKPVRSNIGRGNSSVGSKTGLSSKAEHNYEAQGKHNVFSNPLKVKKGERYFLAVDNNTASNRPFSLYMHLRWNTAVLKHPPDNHSVAKNLVTKPAEKLPANSIKLNIVILDSAGHPVKGRLKIRLNPRKTLDIKNVAKYSVLLQHKQKIKYVCIASGYLMQQSYLNLPDTGSVLNDTMRLAVLEASQSMVFRDIEFEPDNAMFTSRAEESLLSLLDFMKSNSQVRIMIKGYVNDPAGSNSNRYDVKLSEARAKAVMKYLNQHGIANKRMDYKGFGSKDLLYPNPQTPEEQEANRRVEIEVK